MSARRAESEIQGWNAAMLSDVDLMRVCGAGGSSDAWDEFVRRFNRFVCIAVMRAYAQAGGRRPAQGDVDTIDDLVQDVYVKLLERSSGHGAGFRGATDAAVYVYIGRVAISVTIDAVRRHRAGKRGRHVLSLDAPCAPGSADDGTLGDMTPSVQPTPEQNALAAVLRREVAAILARLLKGRNAARDLRIAEAFLLDGCSLGETTCLAGGAGEMAVKSSLRRTGRRLRAELARREMAAASRLGHAV